MALSALATLLKSQLFYTAQIPQADTFSGKTVIVTGANAGLGLEATRYYVRTGADTVIMACRSLSKGKAAKEDIEKTEQRTEVIQVWELDLSSYASVKAFTERCKTLPRIDVVLENAGVFFTKFTRTEGHETTITINVISTFMLALLLLPTLRQSAAKTGSKSFLTIVSSEMHFWTSLPEKQSSNIFAELDNEERADMQNRYSVSKLLEILAMRHLTRSIIKDRYEYPVVINCASPGWCKSELTKDAGLIPSALKALLGRKIEIGSRTLFNATGSMGKRSTGEFIYDDAIADTSPLVQSDEGTELAKRVWDEMIEILEKECPGIVQNIQE